MKKLEIAEIRDLIGGGWKEAVEKINDGETDFMVDSWDWRVISDDVIDSVMCDSLGDDEYMLGCFNDWFLADVLGIEVAAIKAMQKAEAFEAIGMLVTSMGRLGELQGAYVSADGYGHYFAGYDGEDHEIEIDGVLWHFFRCG